MCGGQDRLGLEARGGGKTMGPGQYLRSLGA